MIVNNVGGIVSKIKNTSVKLNKLSNTYTPQNNSYARISEINSQIEALNAELQELKEKEELCQNIISKIDSCVGELFSANWSVNEIVENLDNSLKTKNVSKANIDEVKGIITDVGNSLMSKLSVLTEKEAEIKRDIEEKQNSLENLVCEKKSLSYEL